MNSKTIHIKFRNSSVFFYTDDLSYGDVSAYATFIPSRYSLLIGNDAWRKKGIGVLQSAGYKTGIVGKWHLEC